MQDRTDTMNPWLLLPTLLAAAFLCQAILNRRLSESLGLAGAVLVNASVFFVAAALLWTATRLIPGLFPDFLKPGDTGIDAKAVWIVPGVCGFLWVLGAPWALQNLGPSRTFILLVGSQIVLSVLADRWIFDLEPGWNTWLGAVLALAGAVLVTM